jgi:capsular exopolysaccharide synthesis family protein
VALSREFGNEPGAAACLQKVVIEKSNLPPSRTPGNGSEAYYRLTAMVPKRRYLSYLRERWWVVLLCLVLAVGGIVAYETIRPETYTSFAQLFASGQMRLNVASLFADEESQTYYGTQIELLRSARIQGAALTKINFVPKLGEKPPVQLEVTRPMGTSILVLRATGSDPGLTQRFLQALIDEYLAYKKEIRLSTSEDVVNSLTDQLATKERDLKAEQDKWVEFQKTNNVAVLEEEGKSAGLYLADLNLQLAKLNLDRELLAKGLDLTANERSAPKSAVSATATNTPGVRPDNAATSSEAAKEGTTLFTPSSDTVLKSYRVELAVKRAEYDQVNAERGEVAARGLGDQVSHLEKTVAILEAQNLAEKKASLEELEKRIAAIQASLPSWESKVLKMNERLAEGKRLQNNIQREQGYYDNLLSTLRNVDLSKNIQQERVSVLQVPTPAAAVDRYFAVRLFLAVVFGLGVSLGIVFVWYLFDDRFVSVRDIKDQFGEVVLGLVPQIKVHRSKPEQALLLANDHRQAYAESYRHLRSALLLSSLAETRPQTLLFTGAGPAEGKTTIAANLARVLAGSGLRVALVDADPHNGRMHHLFGAPDEKGVLDFLRGEVELKSIVHPTGIPGLEMVPIGTRPEYSDGLFLRPGLKNLLDELKTGRDFLILDGPPILSADDAALLVPYADVVVMVVRPFYSRARLVRQALDMLYQRQAKQVAIILNRARQDDLTGHYAQNGMNRPARNGVPAKS